MSCQSAGTRRAGLRAILACALLLGADALARAQAEPAIAPLPQRVKVRVALSSQNLYPLPIVLGKDRGWFDKAGLDVEIVQYTTAASALAPMLARGDLDLAPQTETPSFFNLVNQGFAVKAVAALNTARHGRQENTWILVETGMIDRIKTFADLKGRTIEAGPFASGAHFLTLAALQDGGLVAGKDVTINNKARAPGDFLALAKAGGQDAVAMIEPQASQAEKEGYGKRWKSLSDIAPWAQTVVLTSSEDFLAKNGPALRKFLEVYTLAVRAIDATDGQWTDDLMRVATGWTGLPKEIMLQTGGSPYIDPNPLVSVDSLTRSQDIWVVNKVQATPADIRALYDNGPMADALKVVGQAKEP